jgi:hypothetical protein
VELCVLLCGASLISFSVAAQDQQTGGTTQPPAESDSSANQIEVPHHIGTSTDEGKTIWHCPFWLPESALHNKIPIHIQPAAIATCCPQRRPR